MKASRAQVVAALNTLCSLFRRTISDEMIARYAEFWSELDASAFDRAVRDYIQTGKTFPSIAEIRGRVMSERRESNASEPYTPNDFAPWERDLDLSRDPMPHGHFVRETTLPDGTRYRVMSEDLIGPDGAHRGYPNRMSRLHDEAHARAWARRQEENRARQTARGLVVDANGRWVYPDEVRGKARATKPASEFPKATGDAMGSLEPGWNG